MFACQNSSSLPVSLPVRTVDSTICGPYNQPRPLHIASPKIADATPGEANIVVFLESHRLQMNNLVLPQFTTLGLLPTGVFEPEGWAEFVYRFGTNPTRRRLIEGLKDALRLLKNAGCHVVYVNGSFTTAKELPGDFDVCWDTAGVDFDRLDPIFFKLRHPRTEMKARFGGELFPASAGAGNGETFLEFFQHDRNGTPKGIVKLDLRKLNGNDLEPAPVPDHEIVDS